jgi:hypothetical protein
MWTLDLPDLASMGLGARVLSADQTAADTSNSRKQDTA